MTEIHSLINQLRDSYLHVRLHADFQTGDNVELRKTKKKKTKKDGTAKIKDKKQKNPKNHRQKEIFIYLMKYQYKYQAKNKKRKTQLTNQKRKKKIAHIGKIKVGVDSERYVDWNIKINVGI